MRDFRALFVAALLGATALSASAGPLYAQSCTCTDTGLAPEPEYLTDSGATVRPRMIVADEPPPPLPVYEQPPIPGPGYMWTPGYWSWNGEEHYWVPGTWVEPPRPGLLWTPGYWAFANGAFLFHRGYWGPHVGFYGGISYGWGYNGEGYEGGHWDGDRFFYNRSVNNIRNVEIRNVYEAPPARNVTVNRMSYNGGPEGVAAKPSEAQIAAAHETRIAPTEAQVRNARVASRTEGAFATVNNGKPHAAAVVKPGVLTGQSVVPAQAPGGPMPTHEAKPMAPTPAAPPPGPAPAASPPPAPAPVAPSPAVAPAAKPLATPTPAVSATPTPTTRPEPASPTPTKTPSEKARPEKTPAEKTPGEKATPEKGPVEKTTPDEDRSRKDGSAEGDP